MVRKILSVILLVILLLYSAYALYISFFINKLYLIAVPLVLIISLMIILRLDKKLRMKIGLLFGIYHILLIANVVMLILSGKEPDWPMYWMLFLHIDLPVMPLMFIVGPILKGLAKILPFIRGDINNFATPLITFGIFGTIWFFFIPIIFAKLIDNIRK